MRRWVVVGIGGIAAAGVGLWLLLSPASSAPGRESLHPTAELPVDSAIAPPWATSAATPVGAASASRVVAAAAPSVVVSAGAAEPADRRDVRAIDALVAAGNIAEARRQAEAFLREHPSGPLARHVAMLTGVHRRPGPAQANEEEP